MRIMLLALLFFTSLANCFSQASWFNLRNRGDALNANATIFSICSDDSNNIMPLVNLPIVLLTCHLEKPMLQNGMERRITGQY